MKEKHVFAGGNTSNGFFSYFDNIVNPENANRIFILKGGPGVGKSSLMKKFGKKMMSHGYQAEYIHCSSDEGSLDGVIIPELKIILVDGTAPHALDPKLPGAVDEIINLGMYLNHAELLKHKDNIIQINNKKSQLYKSAYKYLKCAGIISEEINSIYDFFTYWSKFNEVCSETINDIFNDIPLSGNTQPPKTRKFFSEAYTANGYVKYTDTLYEGKKIWAVTGENTNCISQLMDLAVKEASLRGFSTDCFYRPLSPEKLQHVVINDLNIIITQVEGYLEDYERVINLHDIMDLESLKLHITELENNLHLFDMLIDSAVAKLKDAKKYHELLEVMYVNSMDFNEVDECFERTFGYLINE